MEGDRSVLEKNVLESCQAYLLMWGFILEQLMEQCENPSFVGYG
jgi:hypothetical protein